MTRSQSEIEYPPLNALLVKARTMRGELHIPVCIQRPKIQIKTTFDMVRVKQIIEQNTDGID